MPGDDAGSSTPNAGDRCESLATIVNQRGLHARAAARFVREAERFDATVEVTNGDTTVTGTSIMGLMMLAAGTGTEIRLVARGVEAAAALDALVRLVADGFDED